MDTEVLYNPCTFLSWTCACVWSLWRDRHEIKNSIRVLWALLFAAIYGIPHCFTWARLFSITNTTDVHKFLVFRSFCVFLIFIILIHQMSEMCRGLWNKVSNRRFVYLKNYRFHPYQLDISAQIIFPNYLNFRHPVFTNTVKWYEDIFERKRYFSTREKEVVWEEFQSYKKFVFNFWIFVVRKTSYSFFFLRFAETPAQHRILIPQETRQDLIHWICDAEHIGAFSGRMDTSKSAISYTYAMTQLNHDVHCVVVLDETVTTKNRDNLLCHFEHYPTLSCRFIWRNDQSDMKKNNWSPSDSWHEDDFWSRCNEISIEMTSEEFHLCSEKRENS